MKKVEYVVTAWEYDDPRVVFVGVFDKVIEFLKKDEYLKAYISKEEIEEKLNKIVTHKDLDKFWLQKPHLNWDLTVNLIKE